MAARDKALTLIRHSEGCRLSPYWDDAGYPTVGWGHLLSKEKHADLSQWPSMTQAEADDLLAADVQPEIAWVGQLIIAPVNENQQAALIDFAFNLGSGALQSSTLRRLINRGEYAAAADEFPKWNKAGGAVLSGLVKRRAAERLLFLTPL